MKNITVHEFKPEDIMYQTLLTKAVLIPVIGVAFLILGAVSGWYGAAFQAKRATSKTAEADA